MNRLFEWFNHPLEITPLACGVLREACEHPRFLVAYGLRHQRLDHYRFYQVWWRAEQ